MKSASFLLLHGAGLGAWIWRDVMPRLERPARALDFPARDDETARRSLAFDHYVRAVVDSVQARPPEENLIVVAHSISALVALAAAQHIGSRLAALALVGGAVPRPGRAFTSILPMPFRLLMPLILRVAGTRPPEGEIRNLASDLEAALADEVVRRFAPEARALYTARVRAQPPSVPRLYIRLTADAAFPLPIQDRSIRNLGGPDLEVADLPTGHLPMLAQPGDVARLLNGFAAGL